MVEQISGVWAQLGRGIARVRGFVANTLFVLLCLFVLFALFAGSGVSVPGNSALIVNPRGVVVDQQSVNDPISQLFLPEGAAGEIPLRAITAAIEHAATDDRIKLLALDLDELTGVAAVHAESIGKALQNFQAKGKQVLAYGRFFSQPQYLVASYADALYLHPMGQLLLPGYGINQLYFKEILNKIDVNVHVFRVGKYKEFVEPYTRSDMSQEAREANQALIDDLWQRYSERIITNRKIDRERFDAYTQSFPDALARLGDMATVALEHDLVDELLTPDAVEARIADLVGVNPAGELNGIGFQDYLQAVDGEDDERGSSDIGVITAQGPIVVGRRARGVIATDSIIDLIRAEAHAVPGHEDEVRAIFVDELADSGELATDRNGSVFCETEGDGPRVQLLASGVAVPWAMRAQELLASDWGVIG